MQRDVREGGSRRYLGAYALCFDALNRLLLCRLSTACIEAGYWTLPGGEVEWGEPPEDAVVRELREETGLEASEVSLVREVFADVYPKTEKRPGDPVHHVGLLYRVGKAAGMVRPETAGTTDHCAWFTREEAEKLPLTSLGRFALGIAWPETDRTAPPEETGLPGD
jgi:8-oxo-dGTP diphosphatase